MTRTFYVYILSNQTCTTVYIGVTNGLKGRVSQHKEGEIAGFTKKYKVHRLVHYEVFDDIRNAIAREKQLKKWRRKWKDELIAKSNPRWRDLYDEL